jgi:hypothetical protein
MERKLVGNGKAGATEAADIATKCSSTQIWQSASGDPSG